MGSQQSRNTNGADIDHDDDGGGNPCRPCFFFNSPVAGSKNGKKTKTSYDPLGSPVPDTPVTARQRKQARQNGIAQGQSKDPVFSSRYGGLEKEVSTASSSGARKNGNGGGIGNNNNNGGGGSGKSTKDTLDALDEQENNNTYAAEVYEGKVWIDPLTESRRKILSCRTLDCLHFH